MYNIKTLTSIKKFIKVTSFLLIIISLLLLFNKSLSYSDTKLDRLELSKLIKQTKSEIKTGEKLQIKVLNGCGTKGIADLYTNFLRNYGYDVIDYGNATNFNYDKTQLIIHNQDNEKFLHEIVNVLSLDIKEIQHKYNNNIFYDITLIIGKDYYMLSSYNEVTMHYEPF